MKTLIFVTIVSLLSLLSLTAQSSIRDEEENSYQNRYKRYFCVTENLNYAQWLEKYKSFCEQELMLHKEKIVIDRELVQYFECHLQMIQDIQLKMESEEPDDCEIIPFPAF